jgi:hypothetical protein
MFSFSRGADEKGVFERFLQTQPDLTRLRWRYDGAHHERPDFVLLEEKIGVELGEWLDPEQTKASRELERFQAEINEAARHQNLTEFTRSFKPSPTARYGVIVHVRRVPSRRDKMPVVEASFRTSPYR